MKKKRIAVLSNFPVGLYIDAIPRPKGYYATWLISLFNAFCAIDDIEFHWVIADKRVTKKEVFIVRGQYFHLIPKARLTIGLYSAYLYDRYQISKCLKEINPDLLHAWGTEDCYALCAKDFRGAKLLSIQGMLNACCQRSKMSRFVKLQRLYETGACRAIPHITAESPWAADRVKELAPDADVTVWEYAVEPRFFDIQRKLTDEPTCLMVCTNSLVKNIPLAIKAFSSPELQHIKLYLAGVPKDAYKNLSPNIIPMGFLAREDVGQILSSCWCMIHTSFADTGPTAVKEARVIGLPVVITTECGSKQYVDHGKSGFIIQSNNEEELKQAVLHITQSRETAISMGLHQHEDCRRRLSTEIMVKAIKRIYNRILASN